MDEHVGSFMIFFDFFFKFDLFTVMCVPMYTFEEDDQV